MKFWLCTTFDFTSRWRDADSDGINWKFPQYFHLHFRQKNTYLTFEFTAASEEAMWRPRRSWWRATHLARILWKRRRLTKLSVTQTFLKHLFQSCWTRTANWSILARSSLHRRYRNARTTSTWRWYRGAMCHFRIQVHHFLKHRLSDSCNSHGIRVPTCTRCWAQRIHSETYCRVRGRMFGHCSLQNAKVVVTPFKEQKSLNLQDETTACGQGQHSLFIAVVGNVSTLPVWDQIWCLRQNACHTNLRHQHLQIWNVPRKFWDIWEERVNWISAALKPNDWTRSWNTSRDILTLIGPVTQWRGKAHLALCVTLINSSWRVNVRTGDCCLAQWRIRNVCSWCTITWADFRASHTGRNWTVISWYTREQTAAQHCAWHRNKEQVLRWSTFTRDSCSFKIWYSQKF